MIYKILQKVIRTHGTPESIARRATNEDPFGPSSEDLQILTTLTAKPKSCRRILDVLEYRILQNSRHWREKSKALTVLQFFLINGSPQCLEWLQANEILFKSLLDFKYRDCKNKDRGSSIREKSSALLGIIEDPSRLKEAKENYRQQREGLRKSIGNGRNSTTSRSTLEAIRDSLFEDPDPEDLKHAFRSKSPPPQFETCPDGSNQKVAVLCAIEEEL